MYREQFIRRKIHLEHVADRNRTSFEWVSEDTISIKMKQDFTIRDERCMAGRIGDMMLKKFDSSEVGYKFNDETNSLEFSLEIIRPY
jgi:hypothetical protein